MTKTNQNHHTSSFRPRCVRVTPEIMKFLCVPTKYGASRLKAYLSLVEGVAETTTPFTPLYGRTFDLKPGQLVISITDMAEQWKWARETVRKFFDQLEEFKLLTKVQLDRCSLITMNIEWLDAGELSGEAPSFPPFEMPQFVSDKMDEWIRGDIADEELLEAIGEVVATFDSADVNVSSHQIAMLQWSMVRQLTAKYIGDKIDLSDAPEEESLNDIKELFDQLSGNWTLWLGMVKEIHASLKADADAWVQEAKSEVISDGRAALDGMINHLNEVSDRDRL